jgi:hypothetical protein
MRWKTKVIFLNIVTKIILCLLRFSFTFKMIILNMNIFIWTLIFKIVQAFHKRLIIQLVFTKWWSIWTQLLLSCKETRWNELKILRWYVGLNRESPLLILKKLNSLYFSLFWPFWIPWERTFVFEYIIVYIFANLLDVFYFSRIRLLI